MSVSSPLPRERIRTGDWFALGAFLLSWPAIAWAVWHVRSGTADVAHWLPQGTAERRAYDEFVQRFGVDDFVLVSWEGCTLRDPRLAQFATVVREQLIAAEDSPPLLERLTTSAELVQRLTAPPLQLAPDEAERRLHGILLGRISGTACAVAHLSPAGKTRNQELIDQLERIALTDCGVRAEQLYLGGCAFDAVAIDRESLASLKRYIVPSGLAVVLLAVLCVRRLRLVCVMLAISVYGQGLSVAVLHFSGGTLDALQIVMPTLVYVTTMSGALHLINYYQSGVRHGEPAPAAWMLRHALWPCMGASVTTAIGLGSLAISQVEPVRWFGVYASVNVLLALGALLWFTPAALRLTNWRPLPADSAAAGGEWIPAAVAWIERRRGWISGGAVLLLSSSLVGIARLETSLDLQQMFPPDSRLVRNYAWLEEQIGPLVSIELLVAFPREQAPDLLAELGVVARLQDAVARRAEVQATFSVLTFLPPLPDGRSLRAATERSVWRKRLENRLPELQAEGVYAQTPTERLWRITARVGALAGHDYSVVADGLRAAAAAVLDPAAGPHAPAAAVRFTGISPVVHRAQRQILYDLFNSFVSAFALICPLMMLQLRSVRGGLVAMIPNVAPVALVFGALGWLGVPIDIGVVLTASVGLGIAVDGTLHFVGWFRWQRQTGADTSQALHSCFATCAAAMTQTTLIVGLGLFVFAFSSFLPTRRFAILLACLLLVALAGDLVLMPALLAGRLGRFFVRRRSPPNEGPSAGTR